MSAVPFPLESTAGSSMAPVQASERIQILDIIRGFAVFGILWMNMPSSPPPDGAQRVMGAIQAFFAAGKFYTMYSFLFGLGFAVQLLRAEKRGKPIVPIYMRRLLVLTLIGFAHYTFLWTGDILRDYGMLGFVLILFAGRSNKVILAAALACLLFWPGFEFFRGRVQAEPDIARTEGLERQAQGFANGVLWGRQFVSIERGSYRDAVVSRAATIPPQYSQWQRYVGTSVFMMFLLGLYAGKKGVLHNPSAHIPFIKRVMWTFLVLGLIGNGIAVSGWEMDRDGINNPIPQPARQIAWAIGHPSLSIFYVSGLTLLLQKEWWLRKLAPLGWVGRMGLTNYLLDSVIFTSIFYGYGLGLFPYASPILALVLTLCIYPLQIPMSKWWLQRYQFGPMEWLWRSLTYGKLQPMKIREAQTAHA